MTPKFGMRISHTRCNLPAAEEDIRQDSNDDELDPAEVDALEDDEGAGEPVDPDPVVPTVGAN
jgi:hypothetical protein